MCLEWLIIINVAYNLYNNHSSNKFLMYFTLIVENKIPHLFDAEYLNKCIKLSRE